MGRQTTEIGGETLLEVRFSDYLGNPIAPTESVIVRQNTGTKYNVTEEEQDIPFGLRPNGFVHANWKVDGDKIIAIGANDTTAREITSIFSFGFVSLTTSDKSYTKFKYTQ